MIVPDYNIQALEFWYRKIQEVARELGLWAGESSFIIAPKEEIIEEQAYCGVPIQYRYWGWGKSVEVHNFFWSHEKPFYCLALDDPPRVLLYERNSLGVNILAMVRALAQIDFRKRNRFWRAGDQNINQFFAGKAEYVRGLCERLGIEKVETTIGAAKALVPHSLVKVPEAKGDDLLRFILANSKKLEDWQKELIEIILFEWEEYLLPQILTDVLERGYAAVMQRDFLHRLWRMGLPAEELIMYTMRYAEMLALRSGELNANMVGFVVMQNAVQKTKNAFAVVQQNDDLSFVEKYLDNRKMMLLLKLFKWETDSYDRGVVRETSSGAWESVKKELIRSSSINLIPRFKIISVNSAGSISIEHLFDSRYLESEELMGMRNHLRLLWGSGVLLTKTPKIGTWRISFGEYCPEPNDDYYGYEIPVNPYAF